MTSTTTSSQARDFHGFLPKSNPDKPFYRTRRILRQPFRELNPVGGHLAIEAELTATTGTANSSKQVKPVQSASADGRGRVGVIGVTCANQSSPFGSTRSNSSCMVVGCNCSSAETNNRWNCEENRANATQNNKREMVKRSVSAVGELTGRSGQSTVHASCISGQRLAEWKAPSRYDDVRDEFIAKRMSLVEQRSRTPSGKIHSESRNVPDSPTTREHPAAVGGQREAQTPTDRCPLLELDRSANGYDNAAAAAAAENSPGAVRPPPGKHSPSGGRSPSGAGDSATVAPPIIAARVDGETASQPNTPRSIVDAKKKKWFTAMRIRIPKDEEGEVGPKLNLKKLSAADERTIEAVLELAGTFNRLGTSDHGGPSTPRTPGAASRESRESLNSNSDSSSPTSSSSSHFRFNFSKARKDDRKTSFLDDRLASRLTDPNGLLTAEALEAYDRLVSKGNGNGNEAPGELLSSAKKIDHRLTKQTTRQMMAGRSSLRTTVLGRYSYRKKKNKNSFSESDKDGVPVVEDEGFPAKPGSDGTLKRRAGRGSRRHRTLTEPDLFSWFDRNPLNTARSDQQNGRPKSLLIEAGCHGDAGINPFPLSMPSLNPGLQLPPRATRATRNSEGTTTRRPPPPLPPPQPPPATDEPDLPPAIPPRTPHRHSTATRSKFHPRSSHQTIRDKPRSYSDSDRTVSSRGQPPSGLYPVSRLTAEAAGGDTPEPSPSPVHRSLDGSYDCVFLYAGPSSPPPLPPTPVREPLGPGVSARGPKGFRVAPCCRSTSVKDVKVRVKVKELGTSNRNDPLFWEKVGGGGGGGGGPELSECHSEMDLLREAHTPIPGCYETSDSISYEDLMEFALDGPRHEDRINAVDSTVCDEIRLMRKMFSNEVTVEDCMEALVETGWNINYAVKLVKLKQLVGSGLGTQDQCKDALMASNWNVGEAATLLLTPPNK